MSNYRTIVYITVTEISLIHLQSNITVISLIHLQSKLLYQKVSQLPPLNKDVTHLFEDEVFTKHAGHACDLEDVTFVLLVGLFIQQTPHVFQQLVDVQVHLMHIVTYITESMVLSECYLQVVSI